MILRYQIGNRTATITERHAGEYDSPRYHIEMTKYGRIITATHASLARTQLTARQIAREWVRR